MQPDERSELGGVGEGMGAIDSPQPLTAATRQQAAKFRCLSQRRGEVNQVIAML
jgi:hypothetical protein